jgi:hypothetical protein
MDVVRRVSRIALVVVVASVGGCADTDRPPAVTLTGAGRPAPSTSADACGGTADRIGREVRRFPVEAVTVEGQCTTVVIATALPDTDTATAAQLCDAAAAVAYSGDVNAVRVLGRSGTELANGITGMRCLTS